MADAAPPASTKDFLFFTKEITFIGRFWIGLIPVGGPFPHIPGHIQGTIWACPFFERADRGDISDAGVSGIQHKLVIGVSPRELQAISPACGLFPLCLSGQALPLPSAEPFRRMPVDVGDRIALPAGRNTASEEINGRPGSGEIDEGLVVRIGDLVAVDIKEGELHLSLWVFIEIPGFPSPQLVGLLIGIHFVASLDKFSAWNRNHVGRGDGRGDLQKAT